MSIDTLIGISEKKLTETDGFRVRSGSVCSSVPITERLLKTASLVGKEITCISYSPSGKKMSRCLKLSSSAPDDVIVADIGCDHAYLSVFLVLSGKAGHVIASDVIEGPLSSARANIIKYGCSDKISAILTDGLSGMEKSGITDVVICGMGGDTICSILSSAPFLKDIGIRLILQPMTFSDKVCVFLAENGFSIKCERYALEKRRPYRIIYAVYSGKKRRISKEESLFGLVPVLRQDESAYRFFCIKQAEKLRKKAAGIEIQNMDCSDVIKLEEHARKLADSPLFWDRICFTSAAAKPVKNMQT